MRLRSFTTVAIRLLGLLSIAYGIITVIFLAVTLYMFSDMAGGRFSGSGMGSMLAVQFLLPGLMIILGIILIALSGPIADSISSGLEE